MVRTADNKDFVILVAGGVGPRWLSHDSIEDDGESARHPSTTCDPELAYRTMSPGEVQAMLEATVKRFPANQFRVDVFDSLWLLKEPSQNVSNLSPGQWSAAIPVAQEVKPECVVDRDGDMPSTGSRAAQPATLVIDRSVVTQGELVSGLRFDPTLPHNYAKVRTDQGLQLEHQDGLDSYFGERIVDVRNALFEAGWDAQPYKWPLTKGELTLSFQAINVGAGKNVVGGDWVIMRAGAPWASLATVPDLLTQSFYGLALAIDDVAEQAVERMVANRLLTPQELTVEEFAEVASVTRLQNHGRKFDVALGASCSAFSDALKPSEAVKDVHRAFVNNALYAHSVEAPVFMKDTGFPPDRVLAQYPEFMKTFADVFAKREVVSEGSFAGQILSVSDGVAVQKINRDGNTVRHAMSSLNAEVIAGTVAEIKYQKGTGVVAPAKGQLQGPER